ncbi:hypothetical protein B0T21DRAFT_345746 [Apiosordaria backusii]|uniref:Uncharacterized protein n=1 Tax=Apiosordaria backusii TaxID=314023 RepID=A0AA40EM89_9PEZI|nr:hypothetical protein B0T21DRAFT_345746 [Apiosordaria backusii]
MGSCMMDGYLFRNLELGASPGCCGAYSVTARLVSIICARTKMMESSQSVVMTSVSVSGKWLTGEANCYTSCIDMLLVGWTGREGLGEAARFKTIQGYESDNMDAQACDSERRSLEVEDQILGPPQEVDVDIATTITCGTSSNMHSHSPRFEHINM